MGKGLLLSFLLYSYIQQRPLCSSRVYLVPPSEHSSEPLPPLPRKCSLGAVFRGVLPGCMSFPELQKSHSLKTQAHLLLTDVLMSCLVNIFAYSGISTAHGTAMPQSRMKDRPTSRGADFSLRDSICERPLLLL